MAEAASFYVFILLNFAAFTVYKMFVLEAAVADNGLYSLSAAVILGLSGAWITSKSLPKSFRILLRLISGFFGFYLLITFPTFITADMPSDQAALINYGRYIAALMAFGGCFLPSLTIAPLTYVIWYKAVLSEQLGMIISSTDYIPLIEIGVFLVISMIVYQFIIIIPVCSKLLDKKETAPNHEDKSENLLTLEKVFLCGLAVHFANYFYSGWKKIFLGDHFYSWFLYNDTGNLILNAIELKQFPLSFSLFLSKITYETFEFFVIPANLIIFIGQLFALIALSRIRWALWATLFYDLTHILIFLVSGIFFYKWILLNTSVVIALKTIEHKVITPALKLLLISIILLAPTIFFVARLGWWDTPAVNVERFYALTSDGRQIEIPSNYFGAFSVRFAQQRLIRDKSDGFFPTGTYGITQSQRTMELAENRQLEIIKPEGGDIIDFYFSKTPNNIEDFIQKYHIWAVSKQKNHQNWPYDYYTHHIFSTPWEYKEFSNIDLEDIVAYRYSNQSAYLGYKDGAFTKSVIRENHHDIVITKQ